MRRFSAWVGPAVGLALLLFCYRSVLFSGRQFGFRDSAHYYYPLYHRVQQEWNAGRWPLWDAGENAGMPLLGNPTAAVLYPGKLIYAALPYPWAARFYAVFHTALAFAGMLALMRSWETSRAGSALAALGYAFGAPVLFQSCNIIFLVGAAWTPWAFLAIDRWLRLGRPGALGWLAVVLAMQVLGGDPESAYLCGLCAGGYAVGLTWVARHGPWRIRPRVWVPLAAVGIVAWVAITLFLAAKLPGFRPEPGKSPWEPFARWFRTGRMPVFRPIEGPVPSLPWMPWLRRAITGAWLGVGLVLAVRWWRRRGLPSASPLVPKLAGLAMAAALAGGLSAAQMVPAIEFTGLSGRASSESAHDIYPFSLEPYRLVEFVWPGVFGRHYGQPVMWTNILFPSLNHRTWTPSLYLGGVTIVLAMAAAGFRNGPPWRAWMTGIAVVSLVGSFGEFASPLTVARSVPALARTLGPLDSPTSNAVRLDGFLRNGDGGPYHLMANLLPGFHSFRFPSKLLSFTALAIAALAGIGWDRAVAGRDRRIGFWAVFVAVATVATLALLAVLLADHPGFVARLGRGQYHTDYGPLDAKGAIRDTEIALAHGAAVLMATAGLIRLARTRANLAGVLAVLLSAVDLALINPGLILTVPQADFETTPRVLRLIAEAEKANPSPGPYRIHRMPTWNPPRWREKASGDRVRDFVQWELDTIQPKYGLLHGVEYTQAIGVAELYDYSWFFSPFPRAVRGEAARGLRLADGEEIVVYPRRGFDLWNSRYFVLPAMPRWDDADRGIAAFLPETERIYPPPDFAKGRKDDPKLKEWMENEDFQILRNLDVFPRAWIVHNARVKEPIVGLTRGPRRETMEEILFFNDPFWQDPRFDPDRRPPDRLGRGGRQALPCRLSAGLRPPGGGNGQGAHRRIKPPEGGARRQADPPGPGDPGRGVLSRMEARDRRPTRADLAGQSPDARSSGSRGKPPPGLHLRAAVVSGGMRDQRSGPDRARQLSDRELSPPNVMVGQTFLSALIGPWADRNVCPTCLLLAVPGGNTNSRKSLHAVGSVGATSVAPSSLSGPTEVGPTHDLRVRELSGKRIRSYFAPIFHNRAIRRRCRMWSSGPFPSNPRRVIPFWWNSRVWTQPLPRSIRAAVALPSTVRRRSSAVSVVLPYPSGT